MITRARLRLVPRVRDAVTAVIGVGGLAELHALARQAVASVPGLISAEFFAGFLGVPIKLDVSVPAAQWVRLASEALDPYGTLNPHVLPR